MWLGMRSIQPVPALPALELGDGLLGHAELGSDGRLRSGRFSDRKHHRDRQLGVAMLLSASDTFTVQPRPALVADRKPSSCHRFGEIFDLGSGRDVGWLATPRVIARVAKDRTGPRRSVGQQPRELMRSDRSASDTELSVAASPLGSQPRSASVFVGRADFGPEAVDLIWGKLDVSHVAPPCGVVRDRRGANQAPPGPVHCTGVPAV